MKLRHFNRRTFLKGTGAAMALPLIPALSARAQAGNFPKRLILFHVPEGMEPDTWWPSGSGANFTLQNSLAPLAPWKNNLTVIRGVNASSTTPIFERHDGTCYHGYAMPHILSGGPDGPARTLNGVSIPGGMSIDRAVGKIIRGSAPFQSFEFGVQVGGDEIQRRLSYDAKNIGREAVSNPNDAYSQLSGQAPVTTGPSQDAVQQQARRKRALDSVLAQINQVRCEVGAENRALLDAHLASVTAVEAQLESALTSGANFRTMVTPASNWNSLAQDTSKFPDVGKIQTDILVAALRADLTRVATLQWSNTVSRCDFGWIGINMGDHHNGISHNASSEAAAARTQIASWYAQRFAYLLEQLSAVPEGAGTMLDNTVVVYFSEMSIGNAHWPYQLPIVVAGGSQSGLRLGQYLSFSSAQERSLNDLWVSILQAFGVNATAFGEDRWVQGAIPGLVG
jgi:hypothetical protein